MRELNHQFYQTFAIPFSRTRGKIQPGVRSLMPELLGRHSILDLGCGNGEFAHELYRQGYKGAYLGLDFSDELLEIANADWDSDTHQSQTLTRFIQADISQYGWLDKIEWDCDTVVAFAVFHHLPGYQTRRDVLNDVRQILT
ncbi:MAG: class I SAM-dependent methyltransferase, partial [Anaerolineales bacterium]